ncbi:MAG: hypothetical protein HZB56_03325 [Deltaproteobacteria bacterium]|nr:hypothetical protein [Deltaproteobacteria bacterium]
MTTLSTPRRSALRTFAATLALAALLVAGYRTALETTAGAVYGALQAAPAASGAAVLAAAEQALSAHN